MTRAALLQAEAALEAALSTVRDCLASDTSAPAAAPQAPAAATVPSPVWTTLERAAAAFPAHVDTMREYARLHGIGHKVGGRWAIDLVRMRAFKNGSPYEPLPQREA